MQRISYLVAVCSAVAISSSFCSSAFSQDGDKKAAFPPNYKSRIVAHLVLQYVTDGDGRPEIGDVQTNSGIFGSSASVCLQYPLHKKFGPLSSDGKRHLVIYSEGSKLKMRDTFDICTGGMKPFVELEQAARLVKACGVKGEQRCAIGQESGRRVFVTLPFRMLSSKTD